MLLSIVFAAWLGAAHAAGPTYPDPAQDSPKTASPNLQKAVFAGGCFWCTEAVFEPVEGVVAVVSGYAGGKASDAKYDAVSAGRTEHAESIEITYDAGKITYGTLLKIFFHVAHDPTQLNRQGPDFGKQYRSAVFYRDPEQKRIVQAYLAQLDAAKVYPRPIVTQLAPLEKFYPAEAYHQDFVKNNPDHPYVVQNSIPKVTKLRHYYSSLLKKKK